LHLRGERSKNVLQHCPQIRFLDSLQQRHGIEPNLDRRILQPSRIAEGHAQVRLRGTHETEAVPAGGAAGPAPAHLAREHTEARAEFQGHPKPESLPGGSQTRLLQSLVTSVADTNFTDDTVIDVDVGNFTDASVVVADYENFADDADIENVTDASFADVENFTVDEVDGENVTDAEKPLL